MFLEFHSPGGLDLFVNFGAVIYVESAEDGSLLHFNQGQILAIKETISEIKRTLMTMAMQAQIKGMQ